MVESHSSPELHQAGAGRVAAQATDAERCRVDSGRLLPGANRCPIPPGPGRWHAPIDPPPRESGGGRVHLHATTPRPDAARSDPGPGSAPAVVRVQPPAEAPAARA